MLHRPPKEEIHALGSNEILREFLTRKLRPTDLNHVHFFATAVEDAGARYERYSANRHEWSNYTDRKRRLKKITDLATDLASNLNRLDIMSRDELARHSDPKKLETLVGSLQLLGKEISELVKHTQSNGRARDLAEERWFTDMADIYENAFGQPARANWTAFHRFLHLRPPKTLPHYGKLHLRQIKRALQRRRKPRGAGGGDW